MIENVERKTQHYGKVFEETITFSLPYELYHLLKQFPYEATSILRWAIYKAIAFLDDEEIGEVKGFKNRPDTVVFRAKLNKELVDYINKLRGKKRVKFRHLMERYTKELAENLFQIQSLAKERIVKEEMLYLQKLTKDKEVQDDV